MKIGILTHHYVSNYGAFLQAYGLTEAVAQAFPEDTVEIINYINIKHFVINFGGWFRFYPRRENLRCWLQKWKVPFLFGRARRQELRLSKACFTAEQINRLGYDVIIVGSDEVWNYRDKKSGAKVKFGHGLTCPHIIAYAPSVGNSQKEVPEYVRTGLEKFHALSARDEATADFVRQLTGEIPQRVLDPTCLTEIPVRESLWLQKPYILFYYCDRLDSGIKEKIIAQAKARGMAVYGAGECDCRYDDVTVALHPYEWTGMFRQAEYVFTGTFHGALFSILNGKQFWVHLTNPSRIRKVESLLQELGIGDRTLKADFENDRIDYTAVNKRLAQRRQESLDYLYCAINQARK